MRVEQYHSQRQLTRREFVGAGIIGAGALAAAVVSSFRSETTTGAEHPVQPVPERVPEPKIEVTEIVVFGTPSPGELNSNGKK